MRKSNHRQTIIEQRETLILRTAVELFHLHGFAGVTMDMLAARSGITKPTLYRHFSSKYEIATQLTMRSMMQIMAYIDASASIDPAAERLAFILRRMMLSSYDDELPLVGLNRAVGRTVRDADGEAQRINQQIDDALREIVAQGKAANEIPEAVNESAIISAMFALMDAVNAHAVQNAAADHVRELSSALENLFVRGISANNISSS